MFLILLNKKTILRYILFLLYLYKDIICSKNLWPYVKCKDFLYNNLKLVCIKYAYDLISNGTQICDKWIANNLLALTDIPDECQNKKYYLDYFVDYNIQVKIVLPVFINKKFISILKNKHLYNKIKKNNEIDVCFLILEKNIRESYLNKNMKRYGISSFCSDIINKLEQNFNYMNKNEALDIEPKDLEIYFRYENFKSNLNSRCQKKNITQKKNVDDGQDKNNNNKIKTNFSDNEVKAKDNNNLHEKESDEGKSYFNVINKDEDNELENYYINSRKDCVEYGLKSLKEDYIVCTKYE